MDEVLSTLCELPGIIGAALFLNGACLAERLPVEIDALRQVLSLLARMGESLQAVDGLSGSRTHYLVFEGAQLVVSSIAARDAGMNPGRARSDRPSRTFGTAIEEARTKDGRHPAEPLRNLSLVVLAAHELPAATVSVALNVALLKLERHAANRVSTQAPIAMEPELDLVTLSELRQLLQRLTDVSAGDPQALLRQAMSRMGLTPTSIPRAKLDLLLAELSCALPARQRRAFLEL